MRSKIILMWLFLIFSSCINEKKVEKKTATDNESSLKSIKYAKGFRLINHKDYTEVHVTSAWPNSDKIFKYILIKDGQIIPKHDINTVIIKIPVKRIVVMSTTNIPALEYLNEENSLIGFPNTDYISSKKTRRLIKDGKIKDLNNDLEINTELLLNLNPDLVIGKSSLYQSRKAIHRTQTQYTLQCYSIGKS